MPPSWPEARAVGTRHIETLNGELTSMVTHTRPSRPSLRGSRPARAFRPIATAAFAVALASTVASAAAAQSARGLATELGIDAGVTFGLGDRSSIDFTLPVSRFRLGFFKPGSHLSFEPAAGFSYHKVEDVDGIFQYDLEFGVLYHFTAMTISTARGAGATTPVMSTYIRPFIGFTGFSGGNNSDNEFSLGGGLGIMIPWLADLSWRLEGNLGYGFDNKAGRLGLVAGLSYFPR